MIVRIWNAYCVELSKAAHRKLTYVGPVLVILSILAALLLKPVTRDTVSDYAFIAYVTPMALNLLGLVLLLAYCAQLVSSELGRGTVCLMLTRPLRRREFLVAKLLLGMTYAVLLALIAGLTAWGVVALFGDLNGVGYGGEALFGNTDMLLAYVIGLGLALLPLFAACAYAVMISSLTRSTGAAVACAIGFWALLDLVKRPLHITPYLFSTYVDAPWQVFADQCNGVTGSWLPTVFWVAGTATVSFFVFTAVSITTLSKKDLQA